MVLVGTLWRYKDYGGGKEKSKLHLLSFASFIFHVLC